MAWGQRIDLGRMEDLAGLDTFVHRLDARAKALVTIAFILLVVSYPCREVSALTPWAIYPMVLMALGRVPAGFILKKIIIAAPFALMVAIFNPFLDRAPALMGGPLVVTAGWLSFVSIMLRFALTVGAVLALVAVTGMHRLCAGLEGLGLPRAFAVQLLLLYRYLFVVADEAMRMLRAVAVRAGGLKRLRVREYGALAGSLLLRSLDRADRVYRAMRARGFDGQIRTLQPAAWTPADTRFLCSWIAFFTVARAWNLAHALGALCIWGWS